MKKTILMTMILALAACGGKRYPDYLSGDSYESCKIGHYNQIPNLVADEITGKPRNSRELTQLRRNVHEVCLDMHE